jgi:hypothetical protein
MSHLGERIAPLVDGQLPLEQVERANIHIAGCRPCREAVELERLMKHRLATLPAPHPRDDLVQQLMGLAGPSGPLPPRSGHVPGSPRPPVRPVDARAADAPRAGLLRVSGASRNRVALAMVGAACLVGAGVASGVAAGPATGPEVRPAIATLIREHEAVTTTLPLSDRSVAWGMVGAGR